MPQNVLEEMEDYFSHLAISKNIACDCIEIHTNCKSFCQSLGSSPFVINQTINDKIC